MAYEPTVNVSVGMKVNLGNYESADVHITLSQIPIHWTEEQIDAMLDGPAKLAYSSIVRHIKAKCKAIKGQEAA